MKGREGEKVNGLEKTRGGKARKGGREGQEGGSKLERIGS